jgi:hypothetical protein
VIQLRKTACQFCRSCHGLILDATASNRQFCSTAGLKCEGVSTL